jgi:hypothetical protein
MLLERRKAKPLGIGSIVVINKESSIIYSGKKSGNFNNYLDNRDFIAISKVNSCDQKIVRVLEIYTNSNCEYNAMYIKSSKRRLTFLSLSTIEESKRNYKNVFGSMKGDVQDYLLNKYSINVNRL